MKTRISVTGISEIDKVLKAMPAELSDKVLTAAHRKNAKLLLDEAQRLVPVDKGDLKKSLAIVSERKGIEKGTVYVGPRLKQGGWMGHFIEFGVAAHVIKSKKGKGLSDGTTFYGKDVEHPGTPAQPFMRPAFDSTISTMLAGIKLDIARVVKRTVKRYIKNSKK